MTYCYALNGDNGATIYRAKGDGEFVAEAEILGSGDIAAIARAIVAALNGTTAEPRVVWHPKAVEALQAVKSWADDGMAPLAPAMAKVSEALALVDQPPLAEKVLGWAILERETLYCHRYDNLPHARKAQQIYSPFRRRIVRLVEEPDA